MLSAPTILVVDDQETSLKWLQELFSSNSYRVLLANSGELALHAVHKLAPELILLDVVMPGMDGFEVCRRLKLDPATRDIPVIFLSALDNPEEKIKGLRLGAVDFIQKPFAEEEALLRVATHLELHHLRLNQEEEVRQRTEELEAEVRARTSVETQLRDALKQNRLLMRELQHRVKNNLIMVTGLLSLGDSGDGVGAENLALRKAQARIQSLIEVYSLLYRTESLTMVDFGQYSAQLAESWREIFKQENRGIALECQSIQVQLPTDTVILVGLIITELLTNSLKHAFPAGRSGRIVLRLARRDDGLLLSVHDDGCGFRQETGADRPLGLELVSALAGQLNGRFTMANDSGTRCELWFPEPSAQPVAAG